MQYGAANFECKDSFTLAFPIGFPELQISSSPAISVITDVQSKILPVYFFLTTLLFDSDWQGPFDIFY